MWRAYTNIIIESIYIYSNTIYISLTYYFLVGAYFACNFRLILESCAYLENSEDSDKSTMGARLRTCTAETRLQIWPAHWLQTDCPVNGILGLSNSDKKLFEELFSGKFWKDWFLKSFFVFHHDTWNDLNFCANSC